SPDSAHAVYAAIRNGGCFLVRDGREGLPYDSVDNITFSPDGRHLAYSARIGNNWFIMLDDQPGRTYGYVAAPTFSADSAHFAHVALDGDKFRVILDGKPGAAFEKVRAPVFSGDGRHLAYPVQKDGKWYMVLDEVVGESAFDSVDIPVMNADGSVLAFKATLGDRSVLVVNGKAALVTADIRTPIVSPQGSFVAAETMEDNKKWSIFLNGDATPVFDAVSNLTLSADGKHFSVAARSGKEWMVISDMKIGPILQKVCPAPFRYEPDGTLSSIVVWNGKLMRMIIRL
ncbi:MAG TPA: hypothetical protein PKI32_05170, partial [Opitutales bacterium]|nr:hypothetical protein [Opitutales bacterium]